MDTTPVKDPEVRDAKDITAEYEATLQAAAQQHTPFDDETNRKLAELEKQTDAAMDNPDAKPGSLKNASFKFDPKDPRFQRMLRKYLKEQRRNALSPIDMSELGKSTRSRLSQSEQPRRLARSKGS